MYIVLTFFSVQIRFVFTVYLVSFNGYGQEFPLPTEHVVGEVHPGGTIRDVHLEPIVRPGTKLHPTFLIVEGEVGDVNLAGATKFRGRGPEHVTGVRDHSTALHQTVCEVVGTVCQTHNTWGVNTFISGSFIIKSFTNIENER